MQGRYSQTLNKRQLETDFEEKRTIWGDSSVLPSGGFTPAFCPERLPCTVRSEPKLSRTLSELRRQRSELQTTGEAGIHEEDIKERAPPKGRPLKSTQGLTVGPWLSTELQIHSEESTRPNRGHTAGQRHRKSSIAERLWAPGPSGVDAPFKVSWEKKEKKLKKKK